MTQAYHRFQASMLLDFDKWHDGIGFDLSALAEMTEEERQSVYVQLSHSQKTWRELEALEALQGYCSADPGKPDPIASTVTAAEDRDTRLAAAEVLHNQGRMPDFAAFLAREIRGLDSIPDGSVRTLLLAEQYPSEEVKQALLEASGNRTECAIHCAALLCYLCGKASSAFDWSLRPFFLRFHPDNSADERAAAFAELCTLTGLTLQSVAKSSPTGIPRLRA